MVIEVSLILARVLGPEWNRRVQVLVSELWKHIQLICVGTVEKLPKTETRKLNLLKLPSTYLHSLTVPEHLQSRDLQ